jgi:nitrogen fixation protein FixH
MAVLATRTFGGLVVENSYVATRQFNGWLEEARAQQALGWDSTMSLDGDRHIVMTLARAARPMAGATVVAVARHPVGGKEDVTIAFRETAPGIHRAASPLPAGRWLVHIEIRRDGQVKRQIETLS